MPGSASAGMAEKKASKAANPPADAPMPTIGKLSRRADSRTSIASAGRAARNFFGLLPFLAFTVASRGAFTLASNCTLPRAPRHYFGFNHHRARLHEVLDVGLCGHAGVSVRRTPGQPWPSRHLTTDLGIDELELPQCM